jgi:hypothetical protein
VVIPDFRKLKIKLPPLSVTDIIQIDPKILNREI